MAVSREEIAELYVALFNRAADADGLQYWENSGLGIEQISQSFFEQPETRVKYSYTLPTDEFINMIYTNLFDRNADYDGLTYWAEKLDSEKFSRSDIVLAIANGAVGGDIKILSNKTEVSLYFANAGLNNADDSFRVMENVNAAENSVDTAKDLIDKWIMGSEYNLTIEKDTIVGTSMNDSIFGTDATYTLGDTVDGAEGDDKFELTLANKFATDPSVTMQNVENITLNANPGPGYIIDASNWSDIENYRINGGEYGIYFTNLSEAAKSITLNNEGIYVDAIFDLDPSLNTGPDDSLDVTLSNSRGTANLDYRAGADPDSKGGDIETLNIKSLGNSAYFSDNGTADTIRATLNIKQMDAVIKTITVSGDSNMVLVTDSTVLEKVDASKLQGGLAVDVTSSNVSVDIKGGMDSDHITASKMGDTIDGGAAADIITLDESGSHMSDIVTVVHNQSGLNLDNTSIQTETIKGFETSIDKLDLSGVKDNGMENKAAADLADAVSRANEGDLKGMDYIIYNNGTDYYVVFDANGDAQVDGAVIVSNEIHIEDIL